MMKCISEQVCEIALDVAGWRYVLTGLNLIRFGTIGIVFEIASLFFLLPLAILASTSHRAPEWLGSAIALGFLGFFSIMTLTIVVGAVYCCFAPANARAGYYARLAVVFAVLFVICVSIALAAPNLPRWAPKLAAPVGALLADYEWTLVFVPIVVYVVTVATWFRFLRAIAEALQHPTQAAQINEFIWWFSALAGFPLVLIVGFALLLDTRKLLQNAIRLAAEAT